MPFEKLHIPEHGENEGRVILFSAGNLKSEVGQRVPDSFTSPKGMNG